MNKKQAFGILVATFTLLSFQNCGRGGHLTASAPTDPIVDPMHVDESLSVLEPASLSGQPATSRIVIPRRIQFGFLNWQYGDPAQPISTPNKTTVSLAPAYAYELDIYTGRVSDANSGDLMSQLSSQQRTKLRSILAGSILASPLDLNPRDMACPALYRPPYATLITSGGNFELGQGAAGCARDLFKRGASYTSAGLAEFLVELESEQLGIEVVGN